MTRSRPTLSASYEYFKYCGGKHLPSQFMEAELDYFGAHSYDLKSEGEGEVKKGTTCENGRTCRCDDCCLQENTTLSGNLHRRVQDT